MKKVYIGSLIADVPYTELLYPNLGSREGDNPFGEKIFDDFQEPVVEVVHEPEKADYFLLPHNFNFVKERKQYLRTFSDLAQKYHKKIIIIFPGDSDEEVPIPHVIVLRNSQYGYKKKEGEIIMPAYASDLGKKYGWEVRGKKEKPVVGFCGWASYQSSREWLSYYLINLVNIFRPLHKKGLYFRRKALNVFKKSETIASNFIIRASYSGSLKTITRDPGAMRKEYVNNIKNSDFTLSPRGDGNFSIRFFEVLSLGRVPLLICTDSPLPLENDIDYSKFVLIADHTRISELPEIISQKYSSLSSEEYRKMQEAARETFEKYLKIDVFFRYIFTANNLERYSGGKK